MPILPRLLLAVVGIIPSIMEVIGKQKQWLNYAMSVLWDTRYPRY